MVVFAFAITLASSIYPGFVFAVPYPILHRSHSAPILRSVTSSLPLRPPSLPSPLQVQPEPLTRLAALPRPPIHVPSSRTWSVRVSRHRRHDAQALDADRHSRPRLDAEARSSSLPARLSSYAHPRTLQPFLDRLYYDPFISEGLLHAISRDPLLARSLVLRASGMLQNASRLSHRHARRLDGLRARLLELKHREDDPATGDTWRFEVRAERRALWRDASVWSANMTRLLARQLEQLRPMVEAARAVAEVQPVLNRSAYAMMTARNAMKLRTVEDYLSVMAWFESAARASDR